MISDWEQSEKELKARLLPKFDFHALTIEAKKLEKQISRWKYGSKDSTGKVAIRKAEIKRHHIEVTENLEHVKTSGYYYLRLLSNKALSLLDQQDQIEELKKKKKNLKQGYFHLEQEIDTQLDLIVRKRRFLTDKILKDENLMIVLDE